MTSIQFVIGEQVTHYYFCSRQVTVQAVPVHCISQSSLKLTTCVCDIRLLQTGLQPCPQKTQNERVCSKQICLKIQ